MRNCVRKNLYSASRPEGTGWVPVPSVGMNPPGYLLLSVRTAPRSETSRPSTATPVTILSAG
jgi:hypothetical protein